MPKVLHAEPLFTDLIRDLGARRGEREWNVGFGMIDRTNYNEYHSLIEYEFAPVNRLGVEFELPFSVYLNNGQSTDSTPRSRLNSLKAALQYTFSVSEKHSLSLAGGVIYERTLNDFTFYRRGEIFDGNLVHPFGVVAKRWGRNFHTMVYTGPYFRSTSGIQTTFIKWNVNASLHYMISGTRNFLGVEVLKEHNGNRSFMLRPQMRLGLTPNLLVGIVSGIPTSAKGTERLSSFLRLIYEPHQRESASKRRSNRGVRSSG